MIKAHESSGETDLRAPFVSAVQVSGRVPGHAAEVFAIRGEADLQALIGRLHRLLPLAGCDGMDTARIVTAASELGRNLLAHAGHGRLAVRIGAAAGRTVCELVAEDRGPGITDVTAALRDHFSTGDGLGLGLPGVKRLMDELSVASLPGVGTRIIARRWL